MSKFAVIEIGSYNTKTHIYEDGRVIYDDNTTIKFKANYKDNKRILEEDLNILYSVIEKAMEYTDNVHIYGCSIFRSIAKED